MTARPIRRLATAAVAVTLGAGLAAAPLSAAQAHDDAARKAGTKSLAAVLGADGTKFDKNAQDFDILEAAVNAVLAEKPDSPVGLVADGKTRLTLFAPTDLAFERLVKDLTGKTPKSEAATVKAITGAFDIDTIESVLLYHVVPGKTLTSGKVLAAAKDRATVTTATGAKLRVLPNPKPASLQDADKNDKNARVVKVDINKGNRQVAHAINRVLRPVDL
ncbi:fasciclin domain-containing protein [Nocardioides sp.]|uniref:fasciclin domain-containing protein n=1 Tax=Nocardioides sp. TaxID=35761 RepID=UPI00351171E6